MLLRLGALERVAAPREGTAAGTGASRSHAGDCDVGPRAPPPSLGLGDSLPVLSVQLSLASS